MGTPPVQASMLSGGPLHNNFARSKQTETESCFRFIQETPSIVFGGVVFT